MDKQEAERRAHQAVLATANGELDRALVIYQALEEARPGDGAWPHRIADLYRAQHDLPGELVALIRAADLYLAEGAPLRSLVMCKRLLELAPDLPDTQRCLSALHPILRAPVAEVRPRTADLEVSPDGWASIGARLDAIPLARAIPGSTPEQAAWPAEIPLVTEIVHGLAEDVLLGDEAASTSTGVTPGAPMKEGARTSDVPPEQAVGSSFRFSPLFAALSEKTFRRLVSKLRIVELEAGQVLFRQGSKGDALYMVAMGQVAVSRESPKLDLAVLDEAEFFGEISLITDHPRTATVRAQTDALLVEIDRRLVSELLYEDAGVMPVLLWFLRDRLVDTLVRTSSLFASLPYGKRRALTERFRFLEGDRDIVLIEQGKRSRGLIIVLAGRLEVLRGFEGRSLLLANLGPGDLVGEMSLLSTEPAVATVTSRGRFIGLFLPADELQALLADSPVLLAELTKLAEVRREKLVAALDVDSYLEGTLLVL